MEYPYILICDDIEEIRTDIAERINLLFENCFDVHTFCETTSLLKYINENSDRNGIIFMDICLKDENGVLEAVKIQSLYPRIKLVFITAYTEHLSSIFDAKPDHLLFKPFSDEDLSKCIRKSLNNLMSEEKIKITVKAVGDENIVIHPNNIFYIESSRRIIIIHTKDSVISTYMKLSEILPLLPQNFIQCHKSFIVNMNVVKSYHSSAFILSDLNEIPISKSMRDFVKNAFFNHIKLIQSGKEVHSYERN